MANIIIDDGTREYTITNQYGQEICRLHFRPGDISLASRYQEMRDSFRDIIASLADIDITAAGEAATTDGLAILHAADMGFREALNKLLDSNDAADIFRTRNPFSSVGGRFFCENVLDALGEIIGNVMAEEAAESAKRTSKYIEEVGEDAR